MSSVYDAVVIGAGQAGPALAARLDREGLRTAIVERHLVGGTCVNVGCTPTKTLVGSARIAHLARAAGEFGIEVDGVRVDLAKVRARMDGVVRQSHEGLTRWLEGMDNVDLIRGHARFTAPGRLDVDGETLAADRVFINVGARARVPDLEGLDRVEAMTSSDVMRLDRVPEHLLIVGGSYIGLEFAQIYRRFGAEVTVVEMGDRLIGREDPDVSEGVREILAGEGIRVRLGAECIALEPRGDGVRMRVDCDEDARPIDGSHLLVAVGRVPNTDDLGLATAGVDTDERGHIVVDDQLRTSAADVWALGEVNGRGAFTHTAYNDYEIVAGNLFDGDARGVGDRVTCYGLFIDPPLGRVGMTEHEARARGHRVLVGKRAMTRVARAREFGETRGFMKVVVDADSQRLLGAAILGLGGDEAVQRLLDPAHDGRPYTEAARAVHIHPTVAELIPTVLQELEST